MVLIILAIAALSWLVFCFVVAAAARNRNRSGCVWFLFAFIFSPLLAGLSIALIGKKEEKGGDEKC